MTVPALDRLDTQIATLVIKDGRMSNRAVAAAVGISEKRVAARLRGLVDVGALRFAAILDVFKAGFAISVALGVQVVDRAPEAVAEELARLPQVISVYLMGSSYRIEILIVATDHDALVKFVKERLSRIEGIRAFSPSLHLDIFTFGAQRGHFIPYPDHAIEILEASKLDATDQAIIRSLWEDARSTNLAIAGRLGLAEATIRARINQLRDQGIIRMTAVLEMDETAAALGYIGIELDAVHDEGRVVQALQSISQISFGTTVFGRFSILATAYGATFADLQNLVDERIAKIGGVRAVTVTEVTKSIKYDYRLGIVLKG